MPVAAQPDEHLPSAGQCHGWWRMFATGGFIATDLEGDKRWRTMPGWKVFSGCPGWYIWPVCCVKNSRIVSGVTGCDRHYPSSGTALYIDYSSVNQRSCAVNEVFWLFVGHSASLNGSLPLSVPVVSLPRTADRSGCNGRHLLLTHGNSAETAHKTPLLHVMYQRQTPVLGWRYPVSGRQVSPL